VFYLEIEHYPNAARSFRQVVRENNQCYEGYANLGHANLMDYCDRLDTKDLKAFDVGHLVVGGFYHRAYNLEKMLPRAEYPKIWQEGVEALQTALHLRPNLRLANADLGLAYLVRPSALGGRDPAAAIRYLNEALGEKGDDKLTNLGRAILLSNKAVALLADKKTKEAASTLDEVDSLVRDFRGKQQGKDPLGLLPALEYNRALLLAGGSEEARKEAVGLFERYLQTAAPAENWRVLALDRYRKLCQDLKLPAKEETSLKPAEPTLRQVVSVTTPSGLEVRLADKVAELRKQLGEPDTTVTAIPGTKLRRLHYPAQGLVLLATDETVEAIVLKGDKAPPLELQEKGLGGKRFTLRVGMPLGALEEVLGPARDYLHLGVESEAAPRFYPKVGVGARVVAGKVLELLVARPPFLQ
jgi:hypothetical protein